MPIDIITSGKIHKKQSEIIPIQFIMNEAKQEQYDKPGETFTMNFIRKEAKYSR